MQLHHACQGHQHQPNTCLPRLQVVRQRDTLRQLLQSSGNNLDFARQAYAQSAVATGQQSPGGGAATSSLQQQQTTDGTAAGGAAGAPQAAVGGPDYRGMYADLEAQLKEYKEEAAKTAEMLSKDVSSWGRASGQHAGRQPVPGGMGVCAGNLTCSCWCLPGLAQIFLALHHTHIPLPASCRPLPCPAAGAGARGGHGGAQRGEPVPRRGRV